MRRRSAPVAENGKVPRPIRAANAKTQILEYLTPTEMEGLMEAAADGRYRHWYRTLLLVRYRHGLPSQRGYQPPLSSLI
jgi:hypothetical protein